MRFSISIPQFDTGSFDGDGVRDYLARAEELGFAGGWTLEQTGIFTDHRAAGTARLRRGLYHPLASGGSGTRCLAT